MQNQYLNKLWWVRVRLARSESSIHSRFHGFPGHWPFGFEEKLVQWPKPPKQTLVPLTKGRSKCNIELQVEDKNSPGQNPPCSFLYMWIKFHPRVFTRSIESILIFFTRWTKFIYFTVKAWSEGMPGTRHMLPYPWSRSKSEAKVKLFLLSYLKKTTRAKIKLHKNN